MNDQDRTRNQQAQNTGAGSRQQEQQTAGGSYRPQGDRSVEFEAEEGRDIGFQPEQDSRTPRQQQGQRGEGEGRAQSGAAGSQQEQQSERRDRQAGSQMGADTRGGNETNR